MLQTRAIGATPSIYNQTQLKCYATACSLPLRTQHKAKASVRFSITASVIVTFKDSLSQTQRNETKYQLDKEIRYGSIMIRLHQKISIQIQSSAER